MPRFFCESSWLAQQPSEPKEVEPEEIEPPLPDIEPVKKTPQQTFPRRFANHIVRQSANDLTCGLRALQNLYGSGFTSRQEMNEHAQRLEQEMQCLQNSCQVMYSEELGFYSVEVLLSVLQSKGKHVQQIDTNRIPNVYFLPAVLMSPGFVGYIATLDTGDVKHYVAVKYRSGRYRKIDSLPNVRPIDVENPFQMRSDHNIYCTMDASDTAPVVSLLAISGGPFVEYELMHRTWTPQRPTVEEYMRAIAVATHGKHCMQRLKTMPQRADIISWYTQKLRQPSEHVLEGLQTIVRERLAKDVTLLVEKHHPNQDTVQTAIQCSTMETFLNELCTLGWISRDEPFFLRHADERPIVDEHAQEIHINSTGPLETFGIVDKSHLCVYIEPSIANQASVGGFYTFKTTVDGECVSTQHNAYSVRDEQGKVHVVYKHVVDSISPKQ